MAVLDVKKIIKVLRWSLPHGSKLDQNSILCMVASTYVWLHVRMYSCIREGRVQVCIHVHEADKFVGVYVCTYMKPNKLSVEGARLQALA